MLLNVCFSNWFCCGLKKSVLLKPELDLLTVVFFFVSYWKVIDSGYEPHLQ